MRIITDIKRYRAGPALEIKRLLRIHGQRRHHAIIIGGFTKLAVANYYVIGRRNTRDAVASLKLGGRRPLVIHALTKIDIAGSTGNSPNIRVEIARAARDSWIFVVKCFTECS